MEYKHKKVLSLIRTIYIKTYCNYKHVIIENEGRVIYQSNEILNYSIYYFFISLSLMSENSEKDNYELKKKKLQNNKI
ncbi:MAG: hypothetical protein ACOC3Z_02530 [Nanoarchaeota archaeon]